MDTVFFGGKVYDPRTHSFNQLNIHVRDSRIHALLSPRIPYDAENTVDCSGLYIIPGLVDVHTHGRIGYDFTAASAEDMAALLRSYAKAGTTALMPSLASDTYENWLRAAKSVTYCAKNQPDGAHVLGVHFEGRYLSEAKRGAHPLHLLTSPDTAELPGLLDATEGIRMHITVAPELPGAESFIREAIRCGATVGLGHTNCTYEEALDAFAWGAASTTHTFNAMSALVHRAPGCMGAALLSDDTYTELICDGMHSHPAMTALLSKVKPADRLVLVTDSMEATGGTDGMYSIAGQPVIVKNGRAETLDGALAGSTLSLIDGLRNYMRFAALSLEAALPAATENPARMVHADDDVGFLLPGRRADMLLLRDTTELAIESIILGGAALH